ncbi:MAG: type II secretion system major pseudopilin GspG [Phycisphaerae bacterium]|nr:type II secretion system major pseudopilin GspG [Phycisphaerae bacterium]
MHRQKRSGFTLFEVLLVIAILALLAAFVAPQLFRTGEKAKIDMAQNALGPTGPFATALNLYRTHMGKLPEGEDGLKQLLEKPEDEDAEKKWGGPYLDNENMLKDPWDHEYHYRFPGEIDEKTYEIWSDGPDGEEGTEDDIKSWTEDQ